MARFHYRLPPCPFYDTLGLEGWLEELAEKGLFLDRDGFVFGFFQFQKDTPRKVKYRLEANPTHSPLDIEAPEDPDAEAISLNEEFGWEYWGQFRDFYIYRSEDPDARELNTDPVVQAMALDAPRKRAGFLLLFDLLLILGICLGFLGSPSLFFQTLSRDARERLLRYLLMALCVLFGAAYLLREKNGGKITGIFSRLFGLSLFGGTVFSCYSMSNSVTPLLDILDQGWLWWLAYGGLLLSILLLALTHYLHITRLQRRLRRGEIPDRERRSKGGRVLRSLPSILPFLFLLALPFAQNYGGRPNTDIPITDFSQEVPFVTMAELAPEREYIPVTRNANNTVRIWSDILSPVNYDWSENAWLDAEDGSRYGGTLSITYHEAATESIAKRLVTEYAASNVPDDSLIPETVDRSQFDFLAIYKGIHYTILLRKGNTVICAYCSVQSWGEHENLYPVWLELMQQRLQ